MSTATRNLERQLRRLEHQVSPRLEDLQKRLRGADRQARGFIRERPMTCLAGAVAAGFVVGRLVRGGS